MLCKCEIPISAKTKGKGHKETEKLKDNKLIISNYLWSAGVSPQMHAQINRLGATKHILHGQASALCMLCCAIIVILRKTTKRKKKQERKEEVKITARVRY